MIGVDGYILKSQAVAALSKYGLSNGSAIGHHSGAVECAIEEIEAINPVDAVPVVHGRWVYLGDDEWLCPKCGEIISTEGSWERPSYNYCYECGAKMDLEVDGNG